MKTPCNLQDIGYYGKKRYAYLREYRQDMYRELLESGTLAEYLCEINESAENYMASIISQLAKAEGLTEDFKATNQMEWVQGMNNCHARAEEFVMREVVYG